MMTMLSNSAKTVLKRSLKRYGYKLQRDVDPTSELIRQTDCSFATLLKIREAAGPALNLARIYSSSDWPGVKEAEIRGVLGRVPPKEFALRPTDSAMEGLDEFCSSRKLIGPFVITLEVPGRELEVLADADQTLKQCSILTLRGPLYQYNNRLWLLRVLIEGMAKAGFSVRVMKVLPDEDYWNATPELFIGLVKVTEPHAALFDANLLQKLNFLDEPLIKPEDYQSLAGPGFLGLSGGVYNPGALFDKGQILLLARGEEETMTELANFTPHPGCTPVLIRCNRQLQLQQAAPLRVSGELCAGNVRIEDFRLFRFNNRIYANHCFRKYDSADVQLRRRIFRSAISELDLERDELVFRGEAKLDFEQSPVEKNWAFFQSGERLLLLYSASPYVLLELIDWEQLQFKTILRCNLNIDSAFGDPMVRISANPIDYDEEHFLTLLHKKDKRSLYSFWAMLISKKTLLPVQLSSQPVFKGGCARGYNPGVIFVNSLLIQDGNILLFFGEGDSYCGCAKLDRKRLDSTFIPIPPTRSLTA